MVRECSLNLNSEDRGQKAEFFFRRVLKAEVKIGFSYQVRCRKPQAGLRC
jgi:hypothetical protein